METTIKEYELIRKKLKAYNYAMYMISWDSATEAPKGSFEDRGKYVGVLSEQAYLLQTSKDYLELVNELNENKDKLDPVLKHEIELAKKENDRTLKIPMNEYIEFQVLMSQSQEIWAKAKNNNSFEDFYPTLEKIVSMQRKFIKYLEEDNMKGYNVLLDMYEPKMTVETLDDFFGLLKERLVPFFKKIQESNINIRTDFAKLGFDIQKQKEFCDYLIDVLGFDRNHGLMKESEHPFTSGFGSNDVRFTVHYYEHDFTSSIFSCIHELGHALYEQQIDPILNDTNVGGGASMSLHESQSRLYENMLGRSHEFWEAHYPKLQSLFNEQLKDVSLDEFHMFINRVEASFIRTEADELTYPLHIMLRFDLERALFDGDLEVKDLENAWNEKFYDYFGIEVESAKKGVLQDIHWAGGMFGYFPTYALGSAYSAQLYYHLEKEVDIKQTLLSKTTKSINEWMKNKIHLVGSTMYPKDIIQKAINEEFNPEYYVNYLINKYSKIYNI